MVRRYYLYWNLAARICAGEKAMTERFVSPFARFFTSDLKTLPGAKLYFYENGTTTPKTTYQDPFKNNAHANPVLAGSLGYAADTFPPIFLDGTYTVELQNSASVVQSGWPVNNVGGEQIEGAFDSYSAITSYLIGDIVTGSNGLYYVSQQNSNLNNDPIISGNRPTWWIELKLSTGYNATSTYAAGEWVVYSGYWYKCKAAATGQTPTLNSAYWDAESAVFQWNSTSTYVIGERVFVGFDEYVSQQNSNTAHNPVGDDGTWWNPISVQLGVTLSGGGVMNRALPNFLIDSSTYTLPSASSLPANSVVFVIKQDRYRTAQPVIQCAGADTMTNATGATDTSIQMDYGYMTTLAFKTDGISNWSI